MLFLYGYKHLFWKMHAFIVYIQEFVWVYIFVLGNAWEDKKKASDAPGTGVINDYKPWCSCWTPNLSLLQEQQVLLTPKSSLEPPKYVWPVCASPYPNTTPESFHSIPCVKERTTQSHKYFPHSFCGKGSSPLLPTKTKCWQNTHLEVLLTNKNLSRFCLAITHVLRVVE